MEFVHYYLLKKTGYTDFFTAYLSLASLPSFSRPHRCWSPHFSFMFSIFLPCPTPSSSFSLILLTTSPLPYDHYVFPLPILFSPSPPSLFSSSLPTSLTYMPFNVHMFHLFPLPSSFFYFSHSIFPPVLLFVSLSFPPFLLP